MSAPRGRHAEVGRAHAGRGTRPALGRVASVSGPVASRSANASLQGSTVPRVSHHVSNIPERQWGAERGARHWGRQGEWVPFCTREPAPGLGPRLDLQPNLKQWLTSQALKTAPGESRTFPDHLL